MILPAINIQNILRTYNRQLHVARLNAEVKRSVLQGQEDRVDISEEARQLLANPPQDAAPASEFSNSGNEPFGSATADNNPDKVESDDFFF